MTSSTRRRRHSPGVYRRRRFVLVLVLLIIAAGVWLLIARPWETSAADAADPQDQVAEPLLPAVSSSPEPGATTPGATTPATDTTDAATDAATGAPASTPGATSGAKTPGPGASAAACTSNDITVTAVTDKSSYASGQDPKLSIELVNQSDKPCKMNVGTSAQVFTITSGSDTWWRSTDCQSQPSDMIVVLDAGQKVSSAKPITWDRSRSSVATCQAKDRPQAPGGGATYHLSVEIGGIVSIDDALFQLY